MPSPIDRIDPRQNKNQELEGGFAFLEVVHTTGLNEARWKIIAGIKR
jgi:hypothetical protein